MTRTLFPITRTALIKAGAAAILTAISLTTSVIVWAYSTFELKEATEGRLSRIEAKIDWLVQREVDRGKE